MKRLIFLFAFLCAVSAFSQGFLIGGFALSPVTTAQTNSPTFFTNTGYIYIPQVTITNGALSISNAYSGYFRFSIDNGATFFTNSSPVFIPTNTAAAKYTIQAQSLLFPVQIQLLAITNLANTSPINLGATSP